MKTLPRLFLILCICLVPAMGWGGTLKNSDSQAYPFEIWWDDLQAPLKGDIEARGTVEFRESPGTIELPGQHDSIYVRPGDTVVIQDGIMHVR